MARLRLVVMGTAPFAVPSLEAVLAAGHAVACVYTQPPRAGGRGMRAMPSAVQVAAERNGLPVRTPASLRDPPEQAAFAALRADAAVVAAYGLILPRPILVAPRLGCLNVHPSLLPRWRGAAPVARTIEAGDAETGVSIMAMDEGLDTGPILMRRTVPVPPDARTPTLEAELATLGAELLAMTLDGLAAGTLVAEAQGPVGATYARKLTRAEGRIDWREPAATIERRVRAFDPWPGCHTEAAGRSLKVLEAEIVEGDGPPGTLLDGRFTVACGVGALRLARVQRPGRGATDGEAFLRGARLKPGAVLG
jgi:methionyl-tRNA formyltransferase